MCEGSDLAKERKQRLFWPTTSAHQHPSPSTSSPSSSFSFSTFHPNTLSPTFSTSFSTLSSFTHTQNKSLSLSPLHSPQPHSCLHFQSPIHPHFHLHFHPYPRLLRHTFISPLLSSHIQRIPNLKSLGILLVFPCRCYDATVHQNTAGSLVTSERNAVDMLML